MCHAILRHYHRTYKQNVSNTDWPDFHLISRNHDCYMTADYHGRDRWKRYFSSPESECFLILDHNMASEHNSRNYERNETNNIIESHSSDETLSIHSSASQYEQGMSTLLFLIKTKLNLNILHANTVQSLSVLNCST